MISFKTFSKITFIIIILNIVATNLYAEDKGKWFPVRRPDWSFPLSRVVFWDQNHGFITGHSNLLVTENGGDEWNLYPWPDSVLFALRGYWDDVQMTNDKDIWMIEEVATVKIPHNSAAWEFYDLSSLTDEYSGFRTIWFVDRRYGWIGSYQGKIYRTTDGGNTWVNTFDFSDIVGETILWDISFTDSLNGFALVRTGYDLSRGYRTMDGGYTWQLISNPDVHGRCMNFRNASHGWIVGEFDEVFITQDWGSNWRKAITNSGDKRQNAIFFLDANRGWLCGESGLFMQTTDGGLTWEKQKPPTYNDIWDVFFIDELHGWVAAKWGTVVATEDGGQTWKWQVEAPSNHLNSVFFLDENTGFGIGNNIFIRTNNGGDSWIQTDSLSGHDVYFIDNEHGWLCANLNLYFTNNGGQSWQKRFNYPEMSLLAVSFSDIQNGWTISSSSSKTVLHRTNDGGITWSKLPEILDEDLYDLDFVSNHEGWVVGGDGIIRHTTDGGESWELQHQGNPGLSDDLLKVDFVDNENGWVVGFSGQILHTNDGGKTWIQQRRTNYLEDQYNSVQFLNINEGWVVGMVGIILHTIDGGLTWDDSYGDPNFVGVWWADVHFTDLEHGWVVGLYGSVDKYLGPNVLSVQNKGIMKPQNFLLYPNRPNPMQDNTFISYHVPYNTLIRIEIYDILGRHVKTLIEQEQTPGEYTINWNGRDRNGKLVPSGTYFYRIQAGKFFETKRMIIMR